MLTIPILAKQFLIYFECSKYILFIEDVVFRTLNTEEDLLSDFFYWFNLFTSSAWFEADFFTVVLAI